MAVQECLSDTNFVSNDIEGASPYIQDYSLPIPSRRTGVVPSDTEYGDMNHEEAPEDDTHDNLDNYIHAQLVLDMGGEQLQGRVIRHATERDGTKKGMAHRNPLFDTRAYLVEVKDGSVAEYTANIIAKNIYSLTQVWHMAHFWVSYGRCTMPVSPMGRSEGSSRRWTE